MKRALSLPTGRDTALTVAGAGLIAGTYGLVRLAYGLLLPEIQDSVGLGSAAAGYVSSGASVSYCVGALGGLLARDHARRLVVAAVATASVGSVGTALAGGVPLLAASVVVASAGAGLASPALVAVVARTVSEAHREHAQATVNAGTGPGLVAAGLLALLLLPHWRVVMTLSAVAVVAAGLAVLRLDRGPGSVAVGSQESPVEPWVGRLAVPAAAALVFGTASAVVWTFGRTQVVAGGAGGAASTLAWIALGVGGALTVATAATTSSWSPSRAWRVAVLPTAAAIAGLGLVGDHLAVAIAACAVFGWGFVAASSALIAWAGDVVPERTAAGTALLFVTLVLGQAIGSAVAGGVAERWSLSTAFVVMAVLAASAAGFRAAAGPPAAPATAGSGRARRS